MKYEWKDIASAPDKGKVLLFGRVEYLDYEEIAIGFRLYPTPSNRWFTESGLPFVPTHWRKLPSFPGQLDVDKPIPKLSRKYLAQARAYIHYAFLIVGKKADYSAKALISLYETESTGVGNLGTLITAKNGWAIGKHWMDWQISNWRDGIKEGTCFTKELIEDESNPKSIRHLVEKRFGRSK